MKYVNPVIFSDCPDPDAIRVGEDFYMVCSSFDAVPGIPLYHSRNLVEWELINHILLSIPFEDYSGGGAAAPAIRFHNGTYYCLITFPEEGIFVSETTDPYGKWSLLRPLVKGVGLRAPSPLWYGGKCYIAFTFDRTKTNSSSQIAIFEADDTLKTAAKNFSIIFNGKDTAPLADNPKLYRHRDMFYILAPAGGTRSGWQLALRSKNILGPYESKVIMMEGETDINGPCNGALVDSDGFSGKWYFLHSRDMGAYGKAVYLEPVSWLNGWPICGEPMGDNMPGTPVEEGDFPVDIATDAHTEYSDDFKGKTLSPIWELSENPQPDWYMLKQGLRANCVYHESENLAGIRNLIMQKVTFANFAVKVKCKLSLSEEGDEAGFAVYGDYYAYICVTRIDGQNMLIIREGSENGEKDETLAKSDPFDDPYITFQLSAKKGYPDMLNFRFTFGGKAFTKKFSASRFGVKGARLGVYARSTTENSPGFATFKFFRVTRTDARIITPPVIIKE
ncbi:MAG: glycoside hydrolase 43 family protein [Clostridia bacterium]|nr:glycoside hydrolase 43 family protein [Clostridia bacterium]